MNDFERLREYCIMALCMFIALVFMLVGLVGSTFAAGDIDVSDSGFPDDFVDGVIFPSDFMPFLVGDDETSTASLNLHGSLSSSVSNVSGVFPSESSVVVTSGSLSGREQTVFTNSVYYGFGPVTVTTSSGMYLDYSIPYLQTEIAGSKITYGGTIQLQYVYGYTSFTTNGWTSFSNRAFGHMFDSAVLLIDGVEFGDPVSAVQSANYDSFTFPYLDYSVSSSTISTLGVRFFCNGAYTSSYSSSSFNSVSGNSPHTTITGNFRFIDTLTSELVLPDHLLTIIDYLGRILDAISSGTESGSNAVVTAVNNASTTISNSVQNVTNTITNIFQSTQEQVDAAKEVTDQISDKASDIKDASEQIAAGTPKPDAPELAQANNPMEWIQRTDAAYMSGVDSFQQILSDQLFLTMLMLVAGFALCAYVLYGKRA